MKTRQRTWQILDVARADDTLSRRFDVFILSLIVLNIVAVVLESVAWLNEQYRTLFVGFEYVSIFVFTLEYLARLWACTENPRYRHPITGRLRYLFTPMALIDLIAILPFFLPFAGADMRFARVFRLMRLFRLFKAARYIASMRVIGNVFQSRKEELLFTSFLMFILLIATSALMFIAENEAQPDKFTDIPSTMWWAVATLTTVGYGDIYPITGWGKFLACLVAISGIGFFALPTGILGASFVDEISAMKNAAAAPERCVCPECGAAFDPNADPPASSSAPRQARGDR